MKNYKLSAEAIVMISGSSAGTQPKYYDQGYWYKANRNGYEGLSEYLVSVLLSYSNVKDYVVYEQCMINGVKGCRSKNFLKENESYISFQRLYDMYHGGNLLEQILPIKNVKDRIKFVNNFIKEYTGIDCSEYLSLIMSLDYIILNTDRHFHNLGIVVNSKTGKFRPSPIFDNGCSLLSDYEKYPVDESLDTNIEKVYGQPFSSNLGIQAQAAGFELILDYDLLSKKLDKEPESRALQVLKKQIEKYKKIKKG